MTPLSTKEVPVEPTDEITFKYQVNGRGYQISSEFDVTREQCAAICKAIEGIITDEAAAPTASEKAEPVAWLTVDKNGLGKLFLGAEPRVVGGYEYVADDDACVDVPAALIEQILGEHGKKVHWHYGQSKFALHIEPTLSPSAEQARELGYQQGIEDASEVCNKLAEQSMNIADADISLEERADARDVCYSCRAQILSLTNKQDTSAEQGELKSDFAYWASINLENGVGNAPVTTYQACYEAFEKAYPNGRDEANEAAEAILKELHSTTSPPSADAMFNAGIEAARDCSDMVVMSREELEGFGMRVATEAIALDLYPYDDEDEEIVQGKLRALVSRVKEGE
jgi:hypothetical protein